MVGCFTMKNITSSEVTQLPSLNHRKVTIGIHWMKGETRSLPSKLLSKRIIWILCIFYDIQFINLLYIITGSLEVLTSDYTESCQQVLQHRCLTAEMFYSADVRHQRLAGRNCAKCCVFPWFRGFEGSPKSEVVRRIGCPRRRQNLHHACPRERFGSQNR